MWGYKEHALLWLFKFLEHHHSGEMGQTLRFLNVTCFLMQRVCCPIAMGLAWHSSKYPVENIKRQVYISTQIPCKKKLK